MFFGPKFAHKSLQCFKEVVYSFGSLDDLFKHIKLMILPGKQMTPDRRHGDIVDQQRRVVRAIPQSKLPGLGDISQTVLYSTNSSSRS